MADHFSVGLSLMDKSFNPDETRNYGLAILFSNTRLTFCILDVKRNKFIGLQQLTKYGSSLHSDSPGRNESYAGFLDSVMAEVPWLKSPFKLVRVVWEGRKSTLIPAPLYEEARMENYLNFNFQPGGEEQVMSDHLLSVDSFHVFSVPAFIASSVSQHFPEIRLVHSASVLIESIWRSYKNRINSPRVFLHLCPGFFNLVIFDGKQMSYFNTFPFQNQEDVTYYLIFVMEQLDFNPETVPLVLLGDIEKGSPMGELLFRYVRHVEFGRRNDASKFSYVLNQLPHPVCYSLFNIFSCGL